MASCTLLSAMASDLLSGVGVISWLFDVCGGGGGGGGGAPVCLLICDWSMRLLKLLFLLMAELQRHKSELLLFCVCYRLSSQLWVTHIF